MTARFPRSTTASKGLRTTGPLFHRAEFVLRASVKASLETVGHPHMWRTSTWRAAKAA
jgi:hypothetical protein